MTDVADLWRRPSATDLGTYFRCGEQYRRARILGERVPPGIALHKGRVVHAVAEHNFRGKLETMHDAPLDDLLDLAGTQLRAGIAADGLGLSEDEHARGASRVVAEAVESTYRLTRLLRLKVAPTITPALVEEKIELDVPDLGVTLVGKLDLADTSKVIHDFKTSGRAPKPADAHESDQLTIYSVLYKALTGERALGLKLDVLVDARASTSHHERYTHRTPRDEEVLVARLRAFTAGVRAGVFLPPPPGHWACGPRYCGFWSTCPFVNSERLAAAEEAERSGR